VTLDTTLALADLVPRVRLRQLERFGLVTIGQLLSHFPRRYEDRTEFDRFPTGATEKPVCVCGVVKKTQLRRIRGWQKMFDVLLEEENADALGGRLLCRWFNAHWVEKVFAEGQRVVVYGRPKPSGNHIIIAHPDFEVVEDDAESSIHLKRIVPIHPATEGLSPKLLRRLIWDTLGKVELKSIEQLLPGRLHNLPRAEALHQIHFPDSWQELEKARTHLVLEEFLAMQLAVATRRVEQRAIPGESHCGPGELMKRLHASLPFSLTAGQLRGIEEIRQDLNSSLPMNRLLHGDVGAGKTLVALSAMLLCVEAGFQAAIMAPTQILAEQHYLNFRRLLDPLGIRVALRTGARTEETPTMPLFGEGGAQDGEPQVFVGTHALLYEGAAFSRLGLAVVDEQHKFGVLQRARLQSKGKAPDVLVMTATPIPRTLTMTLYGDLDVSTLDEVPRGRGKIITGIRPATKLPDAANFLRDQIAAGRQCYIVYPLVEESEKSEAKAATAEYAKWAELLAPARCELLHGRIPPEEKDAVMRRFRAGETQALIATTVIEVGIDVPNATVMLIENAERFGLAQLHQLRGRIGRGEHKSYCILMPTNEDGEAKEKLRIMEETTDGFVIAEADLRLLEKDPKLERPEHAGCRQLLAAVRTTILSQVS
jgi:ATP-dependent DNA helicase RecG